MVLLKCLLSGRCIPSHFLYYINSESNTSHVKYCFEIKTEHREFYVEYEVELLKNRELGFCISEEKLSIRDHVEGKRTKLTPIFDYCKGSKELFRPLKFYKYFEKHIENMIALGIAQQATDNFNEEKQVSEVGSFLFSKKAQDIFANVWYTISQ